MKLLAFETAAFACSGALECNGEVLQRFEVAPRRHGELLLPWADELLAEAGIQRRELDAIVLSRGPGSFTSLRLGISAGAAIAFALDIPIYPVSSLSALAWEAAYQHQQTHVWAALDARMGELYCAAYEFDALPERASVLAPSALRIHQQEDLLAPAACDLPELGSKHWFGAGNAFANADLALATHLGVALQGHGADCWPSAQALLALRETVSPLSAESFSPVYLRERVAEKPKQGKS